MKTSSQIERDFFAYIANSAIGQNIGGSVYRSGMRDWNAKTEDAVVKFLAGEDEQIQTGVVILNIYVPDIIYSNGSRPNHARIAEIEELINSFFDDFDSTEYWIKADTTPIVLDDSDIKQHHIYTRIKFQRFSN